MLVGAVMAMGMGADACRSLAPSAATSSPSAATATAAAARTPGPAVQLPPCQKKGYDDTRTPIDPLPEATFCNNTPEPLTIRRLDVPGLMAVTLPPDTYGTFNSGGPVFGPMTYKEAQQSSGVIFGVFDQAGQPRGGFLLTAEYLVAVIRTWICLSLATDPPLVVRQAKDAPFPCP